MIHDLFVVGFLVILEGILSFDNALALAAMVRPLPESQRRKALTYGILGAFAFRLVALCFVTYLMHATWVKLVGGGYLLYVAISHFGKLGDSIEAGTEVRNDIPFWRVLIAVELTDIAFSVDSILAAVGVSSKLWVVVMGGIFGIIAMRFVSGVFVGLMDRFPNLERSAFILVAIVGLKMVFEAAQGYAHVELLDFESASNPAFWVFWSAMVVGFGTGFLKEETA